MFRSGFTGNKACRLRAYGPTMHAAGGRYEDRTEPPSQGPATLSRRAPARPRSFFWLSALISVIMVIAFPAPPSVASSHTAKFATTRKKIEETRQRLARAEKKAEGIQVELRNLEGQIADLDRQMKSGQADISSLESDIRSAQTQIDEVVTRYRRAVDASNDRARRLYKNGPASSVSMIFSADSFMELSRLQVWWEKASEQDSRTMVQAARLKADLKERQEGLTEIKLDLNKQRKWLEQRKSLMAVAKVDRDRALGAVQKEIEAEKREIQALEADNRRLTEALRNRPVAPNSGPPSSSGFIRPVGGPITSPFGPRWGGTHSGVDLDGNTGDPIKAAKSGTILSIPCGSGYGICTIIDHGGGVTTLYAHMSGKARGSGPVERGQVIGYVGNTGISTGSHLHWELRVNGTAQNPMKSV